PLVSARDPNNHPSSPAPPDGTPGIVPVAATVPSKPPDPARAAAIRQYPSQFGDVWFVITSSVWRPAGSSSTSQAPAFPASPAIAGDDEPRDAPVSQQSYAPPEPCCGAGSAAVTPFHA